MEVLIELINFSFNPIKKEYKVLLKQDSKGYYIPFIKLEEYHQDCLSAGKQLIQELLQTSGDYISPKYIDNSKSGNTLRLIYSVLIPECIPHKQGQWLELFHGDLDEYTKKIILQAARKV